MTNEARIPFNRVAPAGREQEYVSSAIASGYLAGDGQFARRCERLLEELTGTHRAMLAPSCTAALEMSALLLDISPGEEVVLPAFTFVSTANAFVLRGARPVFADVSADTLCLDPTSVERVLRPGTRAIVAVHYAGVACQMEALAELAGASRAALIEDNAHGLLGRYRGKPLGSFGALATQSFHETKNITCGEGGALLINDPSLVERAEIIREKGTDRSRFFRGQVDKYTWADIGSSFLASDLQAAFLLAQLEERAAIQADRARIWNRYARELAGWARATGAQLPTVPAGSEHPSHLFYILMPTEAERDALIGHLARHQVQAVFHYLPLHLSPMGRRWGYRAGDLPVTESVSGRLLRLPLFRTLSEAEQDRVVESVCSYRGALVSSPA